MPATMHVDPDTRYARVSVVADELGEPLPALTENGKPGRACERQQARSCASDRPTNRRIRCLHSDYPQGRECPGNAP